MKRCEGCGRPRNNRSWTERLRDWTEIGHLAVTLFESEISGVWIAQIVEIDLVTQGPGPLGALKAIGDALETVLEHERQEGIRP